MAVINREALIEEYKLSQRRKDEEDIGFTWVVRANQISLVNWREMALQINNWKNKKAEVRANDYNNKEFEVEGKKWYVLIAQIYTNGEMDEEANIMCPISLMLFGTMVSGMTYAFETREQRDEFFDAINDKHLYTLRDTDTKKEHPICGLCGKWCECPHGHNPYPLLDNGRRVCDKCNAEQVIPARRNRVFRTKDMDEDEKSEVLGMCLAIVEKQFNEIEKEMWEEIGCEKTHPNLEYPLNKNQPTLQTICGALGVCLLAREGIRANAIDETMKYAGQRLERHILSRCISSPSDICLTTKSILSQVVSSSLKQHILKHISIVKEYEEELEVIKTKIITELINTDIAPKQEKVKTKAELKKEQTRNANKAKAEEKKAKEEQDRAIAQAQFQAEQERKRKARAIAIKKQKAIIAEAEKYLNKLKETEMYDGEVEQEQGHFW
jgi:hypothetical protein